MCHKTNTNLLDRLCRSEMFKNYQRAFGEATGLPLTLSPVDNWHLANHGGRHENPFCALLAQQSKSCAACLRVQDELTTKTTNQPHTVPCFAGLCETAVPLRIGEKLIGFLRTGEVSLTKPKPQQFVRIAKQLQEWGLKIDLDEAQSAYANTRVISQKQYDSIIKLLEIFSQHLALVANQVVCQTENAEPPNITKAKEYIAQRRAEDISLKEVAKAANMSVFYFCKKFHEATGCTFTEYLARVRVEAAKTMLLNPNARISEVAFEAGFQSITHFNRVFKNLVGQSPTDYRAALPKAA